MFNRQKWQMARSQWSWVLGRQMPSAIVTRNKALLAGPAVYASTRGVKAPGYTQLAPRMGVGVVRGLLGPQAMRLFVAVDDAAVSSLPKGTRCAVALDAYLKWGLRSRGKVLLIGGIELDDATHLDILAFDGGRLQNYESKRLPARTESHFDDTAAAIVEDCAQQWNGFRIYQVAPLAPFNKTAIKIQYVDNRIFNHLSFRPLTFRAQTRMSGLVIPAAMIVASMVFCAAAVGKGWSHYHSASTAFDREIADPVVMRQGGVDSALVDTIQQRRFYLDSPRRQVSLVEKSKSLVAGISTVPNVKILEMKLPAPALATTGASVGVQPGGDAPATGANRQPDVWLKVSVPMSIGTSALDQGKNLMLQVSGNTGMDVRLARNGWSEEGKRRVYIMEGFING